MSARSTARPAAMLSTNREGELLRLFSLALAARRQRRALRHLDELALRDMGLTRDQAETEAARPAWDVPASWRK